MATFETYGALILSLNRALCGEVTSNMRAALIRRRGDALYVRFVLYAPPNEDEIEDMRCVTTEVIADFDAPMTISESYEVQASGRIDIPDDEIMVFCRKD